MEPKTSENRIKDLKIKLVSLLLGTLLVLAGVTARDASYSRDAAARERITLLGDYTELLSALNECANALGAPRYDAGKTEKTVSAAVIKAEYILHRSDGTAERTRSFLSELERFAKDGASDGGKIAEYLSVLRSAIIRLTSDAAEKKPPSLCEACENAFISALPEEVAGGAEESESKGIIPEISGKELRNMAKDTLSFPVPPERDRGATPLSGSAAFSAANFYAELAKVGGNTLRAARYYPAGEKKNGALPENAAYSRLCGAFAEKERFVCEYVRYLGNTAYFVYFPVSDGEVDFTRPVRIGVSTTESVVTLFDASAHYASRGGEETHKTEKRSVVSRPSDGGISDGRAAFGSFGYEKLEVNGVPCRRLVYPDGSSETLTETDFFRKCGVIR